MSQIGVLGRICFSSVLLLMPMLACEGRPTGHSPVPPAGVPPQAELKSVSVSGQVIDADGEVPVPGATVAIDGFTSSGRSERALIPPATAITDSNGGFTITATVDSDWNYLQVRFDKEGYEPLNGYPVIPQTVSRQMAMRVYPRLTIRPGESVAAQVTVGQYQCGDYSCRHIGVASNPGEPIDLELTLADASEQVGLFVPPFPSDFEEPVYVHRLTVTGSSVWLLGYGRVTLTAKRR